jgi:peptide/nickel transport system substrate-binding protein
VRTVLVKNFNWWGKPDGNIDEVVFTPIGNDATRVAAMLSGEIDVMEPVPLKDVDRVKAGGNFTVLQGPELRTIFLGMDQKRDELLFSSVKGKNPFKDKRVRQAFYQAIDIEAIKSRVMRNAATPTAEMVGPGVRGFQPDMNKRLPYDPEASKKLLADAGYGSGFEVGMNCPNDRYVNDAQICQAVAANLARIGVKVNLSAEPKATYFPKILRRDTSFYLLGWTPSTTDAHDAMVNLMATPTDKGQGQFNLGSYSNPKFDELTHQVQSENDPKKRNEMIREAFKIHADDVGHIPLHQQALAWASKSNISLVQLPNNYMVFQWITVKPTQCWRGPRRSPARSLARRRRPGAWHASSTATSGTAFALRRWRSPRRRSPSCASSAPSSPTGSRRTIPSTWRRSNSAIRGCPLRGPPAARASTCSAPTTRAATSSRP